MPGTKGRGEQMNTTLQDEALEQAARDLADEMGDCIDFCRGEYAGFDHMKARRILKAAILRAKAEEAGECARVLGFSPLTEFYLQAFLDREAELRAAADALEGR